MRLRRSYQGISLKALVRLESLLVTLCCRSHSPSVCEKNKVTRDDQIEVFKQLYDVSRETIQRLLDYENLILNHRRNFNLVGRGTLDQVWTRHFADSAKIFPIIRRYSNNNRNNGVKFGDIGTGAGFPGVVFSIISEIDGFKSRVILIDSNQKKCRFLNEVKIKLGLSYQVINKRSETLKEKFDVITCRAVSSV